MAVRPFGAILLTGLLAAVAAGQGEPGIRLLGLVPAGPRASVTEAWGTLRFELTNPAEADRDLRVCVFYPEQPGVQYGRDMRVPAKATVVDSVPVGPAPAQRSSNSREIKFLFYEKVGGEYRPIPPDQDERLRSRQVAYTKREPTTSILLDGAVSDLGEVSSLDQPASADAQAMQLARVFRQARGFSEHVSLAADRFQPATVEAFLGVDQFILAGNRLEEDPAGRATLRHWVQQGGTLWVMLDRVRSDGLAAVLGADIGFVEIDRTSLTSVRFHAAGEDPEKVTAREFDEPVTQVRVQVGQTDTVHTWANGWPAAFSRPIGRGRVFVTTLGARAWYRPRLAREKRSDFPNYPNTPVESQPLERLAVEIAAEPEKGGFRPDDFTPLLATQIGYSVPSWRTAAGVMAGFVAVLIGGGLFARRMPRPELYGWLGPAAALAATGAFVLLGLSSRQAVPPTEGVAAVYIADPGNGEAAAEGLFAAYRPDSGETRVNADAAGVIEIDATALEGQNRRRVQTDADRGHWENMTLPAGVRVGRFQATVPVGPVRAVARFGPNGVEGKFDPGLLRDPSDALALTPAREPAAARLGSDGTFRVGPDDLLAPGQFLPDTVLTDRQQQRQEVYRRLLAPPLSRSLDGRDLLFVWTETDRLPFRLAGAERSVGSALLAVPVEFERPAAGTTVTVPRGFVGVSAIGKGRRSVLQSSTSPTEQAVRFQLAASVLPMTVERAAVFVRLRAPGRRFVLSAKPGGDPVTLHETVNPIDPIRIDLNDPRVLKPDADGGLTFTVSLTDLDAGQRPKGAANEWRIESLTMEVVGRVEQAR
jgi:hypothetical protein